jgi:hypothetical protein
LLVAAETSLDPDNTETRLLTIFYEITQIGDLESRVQAWAWFVLGVKSISAAGRAGGLSILITDGIKELEESFVALLDATADHYRIAKEVVLTVARWDVPKAIEFADMLNTEVRRDDVLAELAPHLMLEDFPDEAADRIKDVVAAIRSRRRRDSAVASSLISLSKREAVSSGHVVASRWLVVEASRITDARLRTRTLQSAYAILCRPGKASDEDLSDVATALDNAWKSISTAWHRVSDGFLIAQALAEHAPDLAKAFVERAQKTRHDVGGLASRTAARAYIRVVEFGVRLFAGLSTKGFNTPSDQSLLALQIDRVPSPGARAILWSTMALKCAAQGRADLCKDLVNERVRPALAALPDGDSEYRYYVIARVAPAVFAADTAAASLLLSEVVEEWRDHASLLTIAYLFRNTVPTDPEDYTPGSGYEISFGRLAQVCDVAQHVNSDAIVYYIIKRVVDCLTSRKNETRLKQNQKDDIARRLLALTAEKFPNPRYIKHEGFKIISLVQLNRYAMFTPAETLIGDAERIPNTCDRGYVLFAIGLMLYKSDRGRGQAVIDKALEYVRSIPARVEKLDWLIYLADEARLVSSSLSKQMLKEASKAIRSGDADDNLATIRNLVDIAASISDEFGNEVASALDDDQAKQAAQERIQLRALKQRIIDETPAKGGLETVSPKEYSALAGMLIGTLHSGRMDSIRLTSALKIMESVAQNRLSQTDKIILWVVENCVERHARDDRASFYLRPLFEGVLSSGELTSKLADQVFTRDRRRSVEALSVAPSTEGEEVLERQPFFDFLRRWIESLDGEEILINDPEFVVEDLTYLKTIKAASPSARVIIVTRHPSHSVSTLDLDIRGVYLSFWRDHISEQRPPNTRILFLNTTEGSSPFPNVLILGESTGVLLGAPLRRFGIAKPDSVRQLESGDVESIRQTVKELVLGQVVEIKGQKVDCFMFRL